jgi:serine/threonine protein kinase
VLKGKPYNYKADIFGAGSVFFNLLSRRYLFSGATAEEVLKRNARCQVDHIVKYLEQISKEGQDLLFKMLQSDPEKRPTA